jgi:hypothetical protein
VVTCYCIEIDVTALDALTRQGASTAASKNHSVSGNQAVFNSRHKVDVLDPDLKHENPVV